MSHTIAISLHTSHQKLCIDASEALDKLASRMRMVTRYGSADLIFPLSCFLVSCAGRGSVCRVSVEALHVLAEGPAFDVQSLW